MDSFFVSPFVNFSFLMYLSLSRFLSVLIDHSIQKLNKLTNLSFLEQSPHFSFFLKFLDRCQLEVRWQLLKIFGPVLSFIQLVSRPLVPR